MSGHHVPWQCGCGARGIDALTAQTHALVYPDHAPLPVEPSPPPASAGREEEAEELARRFHETYERLAPAFGYATRRHRATR